jgi:hypothetical protein
LRHKIKRFSEIITDITFFVHLAFYYIDFKYVAKISYQ